MLELPCNVRGEYHGELLEHLRLPERSGCKMELFGEIFGSPVL
jgi:hypothetical protein